MLRRCACRKILAIKKGQAIARPYQVSNFSAALEVHLGFLHALNLLLLQHQQNLRQHNDTEEC